MSDAPMHEGPRPQGQRHPNCTHQANECRVTSKARVTTAVAWEPIYDGDGTMVNEDPNTFETVYTCGCCALSWTVRRTGSRVEVVV